MMYDTIVTSSPYLTEEQINKISNFCYKIERKQVESGTVDYEFYVSELSTGTYDYRIRLKLMDKEWVYIGNKTQKVSINQRYLKVECSLHKIITGNNLFGGPQRLKLAHKYLVKVLENCMDIKLPPSEDWTLDRIDVSTIYNLGTIDKAKELLEQMKMIKYPRRKPEWYKTGIAWSGDITYHKHYLKYPEFVKHDYKEIRKKIRKKIDMLYSNIEDNRDLKEQKYKSMLSDLEKLKNMIKGLYRIETEINKTKLKQLLKYDIFKLNSDFRLNIPGHEKKYLRDGIHIINVDDKILFGYGYEVINGLLKDCEVNKMKMDSRFVLNVLMEKYPSKKNQLYATWKLLNEFGYDYTKAQMNERTFYRHIKDLRDAGIGWTDMSNLISKDKKNIDVIEFYNYMVNNLEINGECKEVFDKLNEVA